MARRMSSVSSVGSERGDAPTPEWEVMQMKTFTNWCNVYLGKRDMQLESLETDFEDGVKLINLVEVRAMPWPAAAAAAYGGLAARERRVRARGWRRSSARRSWAATRRARK